MAWVAAIPLLPALAFAVLLPLTRRARNGTIALSITAILGALALSVAAFLQVYPGGEAFEPVTVATYEIGTIGGTPLTLGLQLDAVAAIDSAMVPLRARRVSGSSTANASAGSSGMAATQAIRYPFSLVKPDSSIERACR